MTRYELEFYSHNVPAIKKALERIADALENQNQFVVNTIKAKNHKAAFEAEQEAHNVKHAFTGLDGKQVDEKYEAEQAKLYTDDIKAQDDALNKETQEELDTHHDYLHGLVQDLDNDAYHEFCNAHCLPASDTVAVSNYITDLDYDEVLGIIKELEEEYPFGGKSDDQANEDAIELDFNIDPLHDSDYDLRETARMYEGELKHGQFGTKKDCILDYVTNEFGSQGARYTDIIKFAYYLNNPNSSKFDSTRDRGYYACAMTHNRWKHGHLIRGGKDFLVKGINKEGNERYFAHSFVESVTDYWKYCDNTK